MTAAEADTVLRPLLSPLRRAVMERRPVFAVSLWTPLPLAALLPFHLNLCWPDRVEGLPLNPTVSMVPFEHRDRWLAALPLYPVDQAYENRKCARWFRDATGTVLPGDLRWQDWEDGYIRHRTALQGRVLPACAFVTLDTVQPTGDARRATSRPVLGRFASRQAPHPQLLIPGRGADTEAALSRLASTTLGVINLQGTRGAQARRTVSDLLGRRANLPTLVVAANPHDVLALDANLPGATVPIALFGNAPEVCDIQVTTVGRDRPQEQVRFHDAVEALREGAPRLEPLLDLAHQAWWAARRSLDASPSTQDRVLRRYTLALERYRQTDPVDAGLLTMATNLLTETVADAGRARERRGAVLAAADHHLRYAPAGWRTVIVVPGAADAAVLRDAIAEHWEASWDDIRALGLDVRVIHTIRGGEHYDMLIATGYLGTRTLDAVFLVRAQRANLIVDPVEAQVALVHLHRLVAFLTIADWAGTTAGTGTKPATRPATETLAQTLARIEHALATAATYASGGGTLSLDPRAAIHLREGRDSAHALPPAGGESPEGDGDIEVDPALGNGPRVLIAFTDGTSLLCSADRRLEVLDERRQGFRALVATDLRLGDEVVLLEQGTHALFSEQLMRVLDDGELREHRARRDTWLALVSDMRLLEHRTIRSIQAGLKVRGVQVTASTLRSWLLHPEAPSVGLVPRSWNEFRALAEELGLPIPEPTLRSYFDSIRRWRTLHRVRGRQLVRMMRHAALGHLNAATLDRIEDTWGLKARDLVAAVRLCIVEACTPW